MPDDGVPCMPMRGRHLEGAYILYVYEPGGHRIELCNPGTRLILAPPVSPA
ncbi:hypothetical protein [Nonomuraea sp. KM90]|uniref:hypothetical protein n=1 Tax=Nonomuraea sp. KM90 TaxID=3457428 RepID=UPI003FCD08E5